VTYPERESRNSDNISRRCSAIHAGVATLTYSGSNVVRCHLDHGDVTFQEAGEQRGDVGGRITLKRGEMGVDVETASFDPQAAQAAHASGGAAMSASFRRVPGTARALPSGACQSPVRRPIPGDERTGPVGHAHIVPRPELLLYR
jgi:hypothetical protein